MRPFFPWSTGLGTCLVPNLLAIWPMNWRICWAPRMMTTTNARNKTWCTLSKSKTKRNRMKSLASARSIAFPISWTISYAWNRSCPFAAMDTWSRENNATVDPIPCAHSWKTAVNRFVHFRKAKRKILILLVSLTNRFVGNNRCEIGTFSFRMVALR